MLSTLRMEYILAHVCLLSLHPRLVWKQHQWRTNWAWRGGGGGESKLGVKKEEEDAERPTCSFRPTSLVSGAFACCSSGGIARESELLFGQAKQGNEQGYPCMNGGGGGGGKLEPRILFIWRWRGRGKRRCFFLCMPNSKLYPVPVEPSYWYMQYFNGYDLIVNWLRTIRGFWYYGTLKIFFHSPNLCRTRQHVPVRTGTYNTLRLIIWALQDFIKRGYVFRLNLHWTSW